VTRLTLVVLAIVVAATPSPAGIFQRKKLDGTRVKQLLDTMRTDADERKRKAALAELRDADPRMHGDVMPAVVASLQRDPSPAVRAEAADTLRHYKVVLPVAGLALEAVAESDSSPLVRDAAKQALWEYHLGGYRSAKGTDGFAGQTPEPPLAKPAVRVARGSAAVVVPASAVKPAETTLQDPPPLAPVPVVAAPQGMGEGIRTILSSTPPPVLNQTAEPPLARPAGW
jgi:hypothetical protein